jgi:hypothetical protein
MTYWLGVYLLIAISVAVPFLLLYLVGFAVRLVVNTIASATKRLPKDRPLRAGFSKAHWSTIRRKAA